MKPFLLGSWASRDVIIQFGHYIKLASKPMTFLESHIHCVSEWKMTDTELLAVSMD